MSMHLGHWMTEAEHLWELSDNGRGSGWPDEDGARETGIGDGGEERSTRGAEKLKARCETHVR
jgi:hypothetical protein